MALRIPEFLDAKRYTARSLRTVMADSAPIQEGVVGDDWTNTDMAAEVVMPTPVLGVAVTPGEAWVAADFGWRQGLYHVFNDADVTVPIEFNLSGLPRIDRVILRVYDALDGPDDDTFAQFEVVKGTPTLGATINDPLDSPNEIPGSAMLIAEVEVVSGAFVIGDNTDILDRRPWAHGAYLLGGPTVSSQSFGAATTTVFTGVDHTNLAETLNITSGLVMVHFKGNLNAAHSTPSVFEVAAMKDNVDVRWGPRKFTYSLGNTWQSIDERWYIDYEEPGRYHIGVCAAKLSGDMAVSNNIVTGTGFIEIKEIVRPLSTYSWQ